MKKELSLAAYDRFRSFLHEKSGILLDETKQYLVRSRLVPLVHRFACPDVDTLIERVVSQREAIVTQAALEAMTTNETLWFRDKYPFDILQNKILPELATKQNIVRIWSAASSTGQEAYSIAMTVAEFLRGNKEAFRHGIQIIGTDLSTEVVKTATVGTYDSLSLNRGLSDEFKRRYFVSEEDKRMTIKPEIRKWVSFRQFNLTSNFAALGKFDVVFCRNVLIYFDSDLKTKVLQNISACLQSEGSLLLGASESLSGATKHFEMITQPSGLYYRKLKQ
ncbi:CheR family methyltransferase [Glaciecola sp. MF2-115]|uniref:CheR family methyltransferase n=1 Tax=Glaciecola sp. MF2-115 TaxID=3384827 RepID=UPI0039A1E4AA